MKTDVLHTPRLQLHPATPSDAWELAELCADPKVGQARGPDDTFGPNGTLDWPPARTPGLWVVRGQHSARLIGCVSLHGLTAATSPPVGGRLTLPQADLVVALLPAVRGHGFACEAARAAISHTVGEWPIEAITATCRADNVRARILLDRLGFKTLRERRRGLEPQVDHLLWVDDFVPVPQVREATHRPATCAFESD